MYDSLIYHFNVIMIGDTAILNRAVADSSRLTKLPQSNFIQTSTVQINPLLLEHNTSYDLITYTILILIGIISIIWYFIPDRVATVISLKSASKIQRDGDNQLKSPGKIIISLFWINFMISVSVFLYLVLQDNITEKLTGISDYLIIGYIILTLFVLFFYRFALIYGTAFIFETQKLMKQQVVIDRNIQLITGVLLLPVILLTIYTTIDFLVYVVIGIMVLLQAYRLIQIVLIGKSSSVFSALHIILYLCTLEIVPILILLRLVNNDSVV